MTASSGYYYYNFKQDFSVVFNDVEIGEAEYKTTTASGGACTTAALTYNGFGGSDLTSGETYNVDTNYATTSEPCGYMTIFALEAG